MQKTKPYVCEYAHDGGRYDLTIHAYSFADAEARAASLRSTRVKGELVVTIPWDDAPAVSVAAKKEQAV